MRWSHTHSGTPACDVNTYVPRAVVSDGHTERWHVETRATMPHGARTSTRQSTAFAMGLRWKQRLGYQHSLHTGPGGYHPWTPKSVNSNIHACAGIPVPVMAEIATASAAEDVNGHAATS